MSQTHTLLLALPLALACSNTDAEHGEMRAMEPTEQLAQRSSEEWDSNFPSQADLAILLDVLDEPIIDVNTRDANGDSLFPRGWLNTVQAAFENTEVEDAIQLENRYEDWRLVSARISPCAPIGIRPQDEMDTWCWPIVRLVWQPVIEDFRVSWGTHTDFYADDRAVHALYPVAPRGLNGNRIDGHWREVVTEYLAAGNDPDTLPNRMQEGFKAVRDASALALLNAVQELRDPSLPLNAYDDLDVRPELAPGLDTDEAEQFPTKLTAFLSEFAPWTDLQEMTAFSLPEGRNPAGSDMWVFVGFEGNNGFPRIKDLNVIGRSSGQELVNMGASQSVAVGVEDVEVQEAIARGNRELEDSLIISEQDIAAIGPDMADPYEFLVPNTSCASCHRLNGLRFDFHSLSGFEDRGITVSPRVNKDVARDLIWTRSNLTP